MPKTRSSKVTAALGCGLALAGVVSSAYGQVDTNAPTKLKKIVVTGSNIPTAETVPPVPVDVYTAEQIKVTGAETPSQFIRQLSISIGGGNYNESRGNGGDGTSSISLRGIGGGTLILINGRRMAPAPNGGSAVDVNGIPLAAVERIEILKDGGSAIYGSDAIVGVVNFVLKKDYNGSEFHAEYGNTEKTDVGTQRYEFVTGVSNEKTSVLVGGSYYSANALYSVDRDRSFPDPNNVSGTSNPGRIRTSPVGAGGIPRGGLVYGGASGTTGTSPADYRPYNPATDNFPFPFYTPAIRPSERYSVFGKAEHALLGEGLSFFTEASYTHSYSYNQLAPTPIVFNNLSTTTSPSGIVIPANNPYNVFGVPITNMRYRTVELGPRTDEWSYDIFRFLAGLKGRVGQTSWNWETGLLYAQDLGNERLGGELSRRALEAAVADTNPATAFNPFGYNANSPAQIAAVKQDLTTAAKSSIYSIDLKLNGELLDLPAGPLSTAFGAEHREERLNVQPDGAQVHGDTVGFNSSNPLVGSRYIDAAYLEVNIPITSPNWNVPGVYSLSLDVAGRYEKYSDFGEAKEKYSKIPIVPKASLKWLPFDETFTIRASYSQSFKAPTISQLYTAKQENFPNVRNPYTGVFDQIRAFDEGNPKLDAYKAETYSAGMVWTPKFAKHLTLEATWYQIEQDGVPGGSTQYIVDQNFRTGGPGVGQYSNLITFNPATQEYILVEVPTLNLSKTLMQGVDLSMYYELPTDTMGKFYFYGDASYVYMFKQENIPGSGYTDYLGDFSNDEFGFQSIPRWKANAGVTWSNKGLELGAVGHMIDSYNDDKLAGVDREISSYWSLDLRVAYQFNTPSNKFLDQTKITLGVLNVTDEAPPLALGSFADNYDRDLFDLRQRFWYVSLEKKF